MEEQQKQKVLNVYELMDYLHVGQVTAYKLVHTPGFPAVRVARRYVVPVDLLDKWLAEQAGKVDAE